MKVWFWPIIIAALSTAGLIVGLIYDDFGDLFSWVTLGIPVAAAAWYGWYKRNPAA
jgi:hypothetical protein